MDREPNQYDFDLSFKQEKLLNILESLRSVSGFDQEIRLVNIFTHVKAVRFHTELSAVFKVLGGFYRF